MDDALRTFLIEDDDNIALLIRKSLERAGHPVTRCRSAADALIVLGHMTFDLVLLDQRLPDMSGVQLLHTLGREGINVPVLMVTAYGDEGLATTVLRAGALDYIVKDPDLSFLAELPKRVRESVDRYRLQQQYRLLLSALESARDGILIADLGGVIRHVNKAVERLSGRSREELIDRHPRSLDCVAHPADLFQHICPTIMARSSWQGELVVRRKDASTVNVSLTVSPILSTQGQLTHFVAILRDVTETKQLERQLLQAQKMQSVGTLAGGVAHEFNNLLAGINGYAALALRETGVQGTLREFLRNIVDLSERAAVLTRQLLTFARKPALTRRPIVMADLVRTTADLVSRTLHLSLELDLQERGPDGRTLTALADGNQLQQALVNLALNGRDAVREKQGSDTQPRPTECALIFRLRHEQIAAERPAFPQSVPAGDYVVMEVEDKGCGMSPEVLEQALDPFFTTKEVGQGTGLGLPMVFGIIQGHQGAMTISSTPGVGTRVSLWLPLLKPDAHAPVNETIFEAGQVLEPDVTPGQAILVVDDEDAVLDVVRRFLELAGHNVTCCTSGQEAVERVARGERFDLVILDLMMPREDCTTTFQRLRQRRPDLPVLLCTGLPHADPAPQLLAAGSVGLIRKPFRMNELWYAVSHALAGPATE